MQHKSTFLEGYKLTKEEKDLIKMPGIGVAFSIVLFTTLGMGSDSMWKYLVVGAFMGMCIELLRLWFISEDTDED
ncbi:hypothetical protein KO528_06295 [Saccharophagus degradans]|uniref:hypothetical protein n=1 Tax=Saccharophagus degradans TaxID=86304 RepID=UPI001C09EC63|nr:hypothetical protein [Saccharophagus degradans]MBU2984950.1 hypothetical protein [Saccharophagus degradans]